MRPFYLWVAIASLVVSLAVKHGRNDLAEPDASPPKLRRLSNQHKALGRSASLPARLDHTSHRAQRLHGRLGYQRELRASQHFSAGLNRFLQQRPDIAYFMTLNKEQRRRARRALFNTREAQNLYTFRLLEYWQAQLIGAWSPRQRAMEVLPQDAPKLHSHSASPIDVWRPKPGDELRAKTASTRDRVHEALSDYRRKYRNGHAHASRLALSSQAGASAGLRPPDTSQAYWDREAAAHLQEATSLEWMWKWRDPRTAPRRREPLVSDRDQQNMWLFRRWADRLGLRLDAPGRPELAEGPLQRMRSAPVGGHGRHAGDEPPIGIEAAQAAYEAWNYPRVNTSPRLQLFRPLPSDEESVVLEQHRERGGVPPDAGRPSLE